VIRSARRASWLLFVAIGAVGCAVGVPPDTYSGVGDEAGGATVDAGVGTQSDSASAPESAPAEVGAGGHVPDATAQDTGMGQGGWQPDAVAAEDTTASVDTGSETSSSEEASADVTEVDASDDGDTDAGETDEGGTGSESGTVCNRHTCSGCCDTSGTCQTQPSAEACPTSFHSGGPCEDCKAEGENYCVFELIAYICSSSP
jgi:hypothetical protein